MHRQSSQGQASPVQGNRLGCDLCSASFGRMEHLARHRRSHTSDKPFKCPVCEKRFTRRDTLNRHLPIHSAGTGDTRRMRSASRVSKACTSCAHLRLRCDGQHPCGRCTLRATACVYTPGTRMRIMPTTSNAGATVDNENEETIVTVVDDTGDSNGHSNGHSDDHDNTTETDVSFSAQLSSIDTPSSVSAFAASLGDTPLQEQPAAHDYDHQALHTLTEAAMGLGNAPYMTDMDNAPPSDNMNMASLIDLDFALPSSHDLSLMDWISPQSVVPDSGGFHLTLAYDTPSVMLNGPPTTNDSHNVPAFQPTPVSEPPQECVDGDGVNEDGDGSEGQHEEQAQAQAQQTQAHTVDARTPDPRAVPHQWLTDWDPTRHDNLVAFPDMSGLTLDILEAEELGHVDSMGAECYAEMTRCLQRHAPRPGVADPHAGHFRAFTNANLPPQRAMDCFVQLYFEHFDGMFPILHRPTFLPSAEPWQLVLAVAAIGSRYSKLAPSPLPNCLQELLRRAIADTLEGDNSMARHPWMCQCVLLNSIGMTYSGNKRLLEVAEIKRNAPATMVRRIGCLSRPLKHSYSQHDHDHGASRGLDTTAAATSTNPTPSPEDAWREWVAEESFRRLGYCAFFGLADDRISEKFSDSMISMHLDVMPCMSPTELHRPLPDHDRLWTAGDAQTWAERRQSYGTEDNDNTTLSVALQRLADHGPLPPRIGSFARLIVVTATYQTAVAMSSHAMSSLFAGLAEARLLPSSVNQRAIALIERLRPPASDAAVSDDASLACLAASLDCHIALALMLLHTHRRDVLSLAHESVKGKDAQSSQVLHRRLEGWFREDGGRRARAAALHAGRLWAVLRRSSTQAHGFYEPIAALLAILVLWCYNRVASASASAEGDGPVPGPASTHRKTVVRLDRLSTDTQAWLDSHAPLTIAHLHGVGNIARPGAADRILEVGRTLLQELDIWPLSHGFATWLGKMKAKPSAKTDKRTPTPASLRRLGTAVPADYAIRQTGQAGEGDMDKDAVTFDPTVEHHPTLPFRLMRLILNAR